MGDLYTVEFENQTVATASGDYDIFELRPATTAPITLVGFELDPTTVLGDVDEEQWRIRLISMIGGTFTSGTGGATPTPVPVDLSVNAIPAAGFGADTMNTAVATTTGTTRNHGSFAFNARIGTGMVVIPPEMRVKIPPLANTGLLLRLMAAIATDESLSGTAWVQEGA